MGDWIPGTREEQITMAKAWISALQERGAEWDVPVDITAELSSMLISADTIFKIAISAERTERITTECQRLFGVLIKKMRFIKDQYFKKPPLFAEDFTALLLGVPDAAQTPKGAPKAQVTAEIGSSGAAMLVLHYKYVEGVEYLADPQTDIRYQTRYGLMPQEGAQVSGNDLSSPPVVPEDLPYVFDTKRKKDSINFTIADSGKTAYFCVRLENGSGVYGPWCPFFHALVP